MEERKIVVIDAGHGGADPGATYQGRLEKDDNLKLAMAVGGILADHGVDVRYTRIDDTYNTPLEKAMMANAAEADYFISMHRNAMPVPGSGSGVQVLVFEDNGEEAVLADNITKHLSKAGFMNLGVIERPRLVVLKRTNMPAVIVEAGFIDNQEDNCLFDSNFEGIASELANGILESINEIEEEPVEEVPEEEEPVEEEPVEEVPEYYQVQVGAFRVRPLAENQANILKTQGFPVFIVYEDGLYKVRVGAFQDLDNAVRMEQVLRRFGYNTYLVKRPAVY